METLFTGYTKELEKELATDLSVSVWKRRKHSKVRRCCLHTRCTLATTENIERYCSFHTEFMQTVLAEHAHKARFYLLYDLRDTATPEGLKSTLVPFVQLHNRFREEYKRVLIGTAIIINNATLQMLLNGIFSTVYNPARPVRILTSPDELDDEWR